MTPARLLCSRDFPGKSTGVGYHFILQGIFPTQESNQHLLHCRWILYQLSYRGMLKFVCFLTVLQSWASFLHVLKLSANACTCHRRGTHRMLVARQKTVWVRCGECWECLWASWGDLLVRPLQRFVGDPLMESTKQKNSHLFDAFQALPTVFPASPHS